MLLNDIYIQLFFQDKYDIPFTRVLYGQAKLYRIDVTLVWNPTLLYSQNYRLWDISTWSAAPEMSNPWWHHQMETFSALLALCAVREINRSPVTQSFDIFLDRRLNKRLRYNRKACDLRRHLTHYDAIVMRGGEFKQVHRKN